MGFHVSELTHENLLNYLYFRSHKWNDRLQGAAACCCMHETEVCIGRIIDGPDLASFSFLKQKRSPIEFLFISSSIDRGWAIISSHLPFCAEGKERWAYFPFPWACSLSTMIFHFKILEITLFKKKKSAHGKILAIYGLSPCLPPPPPGLQPLFLPRWIFYPGDLLSEVKMDEKRSLVNTLDSKCEIKQEKKSQNVE